MPRQRDEAQREAVFAEINATARRLMAAQGTAGLSMRGIARAMGMTAPALYHYYPSLDDLITALILENFHALADSMEAAVEAAALSCAAQVLAAAGAYRAWALANPVDFELIYGTPIPGYEAPGDLTVPAAARAMTLMVRLLVDGLGSGAIIPAPPYDVPPAALRDDLVAMVGTDDSQVVLAGYLGVVGWARIHGIVMLEVTGHITPVIADMETFFRSEMHILFRQMGLNT